MEVEEPLVLNDSVINIKGKNMEGNKRKFESVNGSLDSSFKKKKKRKKSQQEKKGCFHYKNTSNYIEVEAKPESLPSTFEIFDSKSQEKSTENVQKPFLNFLTAKSFNTDTKARFYMNLYDYFVKGGEITNKDEKSLSKKKKRKNDIKNISKAETEISLKGDKNVSNTETEVSPKEAKNISNTETEISPQKLNESVKIKSYVDMYKVVSSKAQIFHLHHPCFFSFQGEIKVTLISGKIEVLGFTLSHSFGNTKADLYSPTLCTPLVVESQPHEQSKSLEEIKISLSDLLTQEDVNNLLSKINPNDTILLIEPLYSNFGIVLNRYSARPLFSKDVEEFSTVSKSSKRLQSVFNFTLSKNSKVFRKNYQWDKIPVRHCTILCGGKGVGKSTLLKYFINKLVGMQEKLLCLDFDPGQPEFTHPGCLSAVVIDKPLLGPNFTHIIKPRIMVYFGEIEVTRSPAKYLECVRFIIEKCTENDELSGMKWCVNTMGFSKGIGVGIMVSILKLLRPDTVIQLKSNDSRRNYPFYMTPANVNMRRGFKITENPLLSFDLCIFDSYAEQNGKAIQSGMNSKRLREIMSLSYFSQMVSSPYYNFNAVQPYLISFSIIYLAVDILIPPNDMLKAFNGSVVSLSYFEPSFEEILSPDSENCNYFKIVVKPNISHSSGLGLVRGINLEEKTLYIITPLSAEEMDKINCLTLGRISPPLAMFLKQESVEGETVYTSVGTGDIAQEVKRMFRVPISQLF